MRSLSVETDLGKDENLISDSHRKPHSYIAPSYQVLEIQRKDRQKHRRFLLTHAGLAALTCSLAGAAFGTTPQSVVDDVLLGTCILVRIL